MPPAELHPDGRFKSATLVATLGWLINIWGYVARSLASLAYPSWCRDAPDLNVITFCGLLLSTVTPVSNPAYWYSELEFDASPSLMGPLGIPRY